MNKGFYHFYFLFFILFFDVKELFVRNDDVQSFFLVEAKRSQNSNKLKASKNIEESEVTVSIDSTGTLESVGEDDSNFKDRDEKDNEDEDDDDESDFESDSTSSKSSSSTSAIGDEMVEGPRKARYEQVTVCNENSQSAFLFHEVILDIDATNGYKGVTSGNKNKMQLYYIYVDRVFGQECASNVSVLPGADYSVTVLPNPAIVNKRSANDAEEHLEDTGYVPPGDLQKHLEIQVCLGNWV